MAKSNHCRQKGDFLFLNWMGRFSRFNNGTGDKTRTINGKVFKIYDGMLKMGVKGLTHDVS